MSGPTESSSAVYKAETLTRGRASHFSSKSCCICELYLMILTSELLRWRAKYPGQKSFRSEFIVRTRKPNRLLYLGH